VVLRDELREKRFRKIRADRGGVHFEGELSHAYRACLEIRTAMRVLEELSTFPARTGEALYEGVRNIDFDPLVDPKGTLAVRASVSSSALTHTQFVAQRVKDAIVDRIRERSGVRPDVDREDPELGVFVRIQKDVATVYADLSGQPLHLRGWRKSAGEAPIKETLAAALLRFARYDGTAPFVDPMCGAGTIAIEAGCIAANIAPGIGVARFGFERFPRFDASAAGALASLRGELRAKARAGAEIVARDRDPRAIAETVENAARAGVKIRAEVGRVEAMDHDLGGATLVTNPPYGVRLDGSEGASITRALASLEHGRIGVITPDEDFLRAIGRRPDVHEVMNGDLRCAFGVFEKL
jgi:23S rRNA G2445 N2-methylase RlmL